MCGRAVLINPHAIADWFDVEAPSDLPPRYNIAPTQLLAVIRTPHKLEMLKWGIVRAPKRPLQINMRVEQILKTANRQRRCLVVVDGFYEWRKSEGSTRGQPFLIRDEQGHPLGMGGVWNKTTTSDGEVLESVAILTCPPKPPVDSVHDRMPLVIPRADYARWIDMAADVTDLLQPASTTLAMVPVSSYVNSPKNDGPQAIEPVEPDPAQEGLFR